MKHSRIHINSSYIVDNEIYITPPNAVMKEPPYATEDDEPIVFDQVDEELKERTLQAFRNIKMSLYECTVVFVVVMERYIGFFHIPKQGTWAELTYQIMKSLREANIFLNTLTYQFGFSNDAVYQPNKTKILDMRKGSPYELVPCFSVLKVVLGHVDELGWIPLQRRNICFQCGIPDALPQKLVRLKRCKACQCAVYCSKECQLADWKNHKVHCVKPTKATQKN